MKREDAVRMAREAGFNQPWTAPKETQERLTRFAKLAAEWGAKQEREACAKVCEKQMKSYMSKQYTTDPLGGFRERFAAEQCAAAIRARGQENKS